ncbi:YadA-like family protein (plasmid) [Dyella sp. BiH032]|uniref:YadA-like family protein n=1 Tax=Dyella sp. BiH032 TaxID=3075430 RepID=UPI002892B5B3|nr:YadA-like family protein [Dyella sp. BiH032]WNL48514.1 YadA-like family protein [Dyella sp. BiH032]
MANSYAIALGYASNAGLYGLSLGVNSTAANYGTSVGYFAKTSASATALGYYSSATGTSDIAIGVSAVSNSSFGIAIGGEANVSSPYSVALGAEASASSNGSVAIGYRAQAGHDGSVALGSGSTVTYDPYTGVAAYLLSNQSSVGAVSIGSSLGTRNLQYVSAGIADTDAVNVAQLKVVNSDLAAFKSSASAQLDQINLGYSYAKVGVGAMALDGATALGANALANNESATVVGTGAQTQGLYSVAVGASSGYAARADYTTDLGGQASSTAAYSTSLGYSATATQTNSVALGANAQATRGGMASYTAYMLGAQASVGEIGIGTPNGQRQITGVAPGSSDTDAVNVLQLKAVGEVASQASAAVGLAIQYDSQAKDKITLSGSEGATLSNVKSGVADLDAVNVAQLTGVSQSLGTRLDGLQAVVGSTVRYTNPFAITLGTTGTGGSAVTITNVAGGVGPLDAVNKAQLDGLNSALTPGIANAQEAADAANASVAALNASAVKYTSASTIKLGNGAGMVRLSNVDYAVNDYDAVNLALLNSVKSGLETSLINLQSGAVVYGDGGHTQVTLGDGINAVNLHNVADGVSAGDAVNKSQLDALLATIPATDPLALSYTDANKTTLALAGASGTQIKNVAAGVVGSDAVNMNQLTAVDTNARDGIAGLTASTTSIQGTLQALGNRAVVFTDSSHTAVRLTSDGAGVLLSGVADGQGATDAINKRQLDAAVANLATTNPLALSYSDASKSRLVLQGSGGTQISNVAAGQDDGDAVNVGQLSAVNSRVSGSITDIQNQLGVAQGELATLSSTAVRFSDSSKTALDLGDGARVVRVSHVADGVDAGDAVNKGQLDALASLVATGSVTGVAYSDGSKARLELGGQNGTTIANVAAGVSTSDAVNYGQLLRVDDKVASAFTALGGGASIGFGVFVPPSYSLQGMTYGSVGDAFVAVDKALSTNIARITSLESKVAAGAATGSTGQSATVAPNTNAVAMGGSSSANGQNATAVGGDSFAAGAGDTALGGGARVNADYSTAVGSNTHIKAVATHSVALGANASVEKDHSVAVGEGADAQAQNAVALGAGSVADRDNTVSVGAAGKERAVTNVAAGTATTDAANVGQVDAAVQDAIKQAKAYSAQQFVDMQTGIDQFAQKVNDRFHAVDVSVARTGAMATAMSQMGTASAGASGSGRIAAGVGYQGGEKALAVGFATQLGDRVHVNFGGAVTSGARTIGGGIGVDL